MRKSHFWLVGFLIGCLVPPVDKNHVLGCLMVCQASWSGDLVMWPRLVARSCDYVSRSHDQIPTVMWPDFGGQKIWLYKQVTWPGHVTFFPRSYGIFWWQKSWLCNQVTWSNSHGHVTSFLWSGWELDPQSKFGNWLT